VAIELELSGKKPAEYERILRWSGSTLDYRQVAWFCATPALQRRLAELVARERLDDFISVEPVPAGAAVSLWGSAGQGAGARSGAIAADVRSSAGSPKRRGVCVGWATAHRAAARRCATGGSAAGPEPRLPGGDQHRKCSFPAGPLLRRALSGIRDRSTEEASAVSAPDT
jgi:hypothetical protein